LTKYTVNFQGRLFQVACGRQRAIFGFYQPEIFRLIPG
jgi:hypothetical protein